jgi:hypothetical protein
VTVPKGIVNLDTLAGARGQIKVLAFEFQVRLGFPAGVQRLDKDLAHSSKVRAVAGKGVQRSAQWLEREFKDQPGGAGLRVKDQDAGFKVAFISIHLGRDLAP